MSSSAMSSTHITTSLLIPGDPQPLYAEVLGAEATATTYVVNCVPTPGNEDACGTFNETVTLGPWASKTLPPGADETGVFDLYVNIPYEEDPWTFSIHCQMSRSLAQECVTTNIGGNDDDMPTATLSSSALDEYGFATFEYMPVTITAGQQYLSAASSRASQTAASSGASKSAQTSGATKTGSDSDSTDSSGSAVGSAASSAASPEKTNAAASCAVRVLTAMSVAGIAISAIML